MSARKATRSHKRGDKTKRTRRRTAAPTAAEIEDARLALLGVYAVCELVHSSYTASRTARIVLTRGALQPLREILELLGEKDLERFLWGKMRPLGPVRCEGDDHEQAPHGA